MSRTQVFAGTLTVLDCPQCGMTFGITTEYEKRRRDDHANFYCPQGHPMVYGQKTKAEREAKRFKARSERLAAQLSEAWEADAALPGDVRDARERAMGYKDKPAQRGAFWRGHSDRECGRETGCCPYPTNRFGFRAAWFDGFGEDPESPPEERDG